MINALKKIILDEDSQEWFSNWLRNDAAPTYGMIVIGIMAASLSGEPEFGLAILQSLVGTDYVSTSFAFIFTAHYTWSREIKYSGNRATLWAIVFCVVFFVLMKIDPLTVPNKYSEFKFEDVGRFHIMFTIFSLFSIFFTFMTLWYLKFINQNNVANV